ncbi:MAG: 3-hydroxyacyl-CoA dehydrogenase family protein, partial [Halobacteriales archaeon]
MRGLSEIDTIGVVGAGTMGSGIAQVAATSGFDVVMRDVEPELVDRGFDTIEDSLDRLVGRDSLDAEAADAALDRINGTTDLDALADADYVVEAVVEDLAVKREVFAELDGHVDEEVCLATNTSTLSITSIASATERERRVVGLHFMNPVPVMEGVEVVVGEHTAPDTVQLAHDLAAELGKTTWESDDKPGFVVNRVLIPWINEGIRAYDE